MTVEPVVGGLGAGDVHPRGQAEHRTRRRVAGDDRDVVAVGAVDDDGVGRAVAVAAADGGQVGVHLGHVGAG